MNMLASIIKYWSLPCVICVWFAALLPTIVAGGADQTHLLPSSLLSHRNLQGMYVTFTRDKI